MRRLSPVLLLSALLAPVATAQTVDYVELGESTDRTDGVANAAFFSIVLEGSGFGSAVVVTPGGLPVPLFPGGFGFFETVVPFVTAAEREAQFPNGSYQLFLDSAFEGAAVFNPAMPDGFAPISFPSERETGVAVDPTFTFSNNCTNCITTTDGVPAAADLEVGVYTVVTETLDTTAFIPPTSTSFNFAIPLTPGEPYGFYTAAFVNDIDTSAGFEYEQFSEEINFVEFVTGVPGIASGICGDLDFDFVLSAQDAGRFRAALADPLGAGLSPAERARCAVIGGPASCTIRQVAVINRTLNDESSLPGVAEVCDDAPPDAIGVYTGTASKTTFGCVDPDDDEFVTAPVTIEITSQDPYGLFEGTATASLGSFTEVTNLTGLIAGDGSIQAGGIGEFDFGGAFLSKSLSDLPGSLLGNTFSLDGDGADVLGNTCSFTLNLTGTR